jgi:hypothetical protein
MHSRLPRSSSPLDERIMSLLVHKDMFAVDGHEVTNETKNALICVVRHLRLLRFELMDVLRWHVNEQLLHTPMRMSELLSLR